MKDRNYIRENGAITFGRNTVDNLFKPDYVRPRTNIITTSRGSAVPRHWSNSPTMSGGNAGLGMFRFGANPRSKNNVLSYKDFIGKSNSFSNISKKII